MKTLSPRKFSWALDWQSDDQQKETYLKRIFRTVPLLIFIFGIYPIIISDVIIMETFVMGDIDLWPNSSAIVGLLASTWHETPDGGAMKVYSPTVLIRAALVEVFGQLAAGKMFLLFMLPASMMSMYYASRMFGRSSAVRYLSAFLYAFNPISIGEFISASPLLLFYAFFPIVLYSFVRLLEAIEVDWVRILKFSMTASFSILILLDSLVILPFLILIISVIFAIKHSSQTRIFLKNLSLSIALCAILVLPLLIGNFVPLTELGSNVESVVANPLKDVEYIYSKAHFLNLAKLAGNEGTGMSQLGYNAPNQLWNFAGLVIPAMMMYGIAFTKISPHKKYLIMSLGVAFISLTLFLWATREKLSYPLFDMFPVLFTFRNPRKLMFILSLAASILFALGVGHLLRKVQHRSLWKVSMPPLVISVVMALLLTYSWPLFSTDLGMSVARPAFPEGYKIPERYFAMSDMVRNQLGDQDVRTVWLPLDLNTQYAITGMNINPYFLPSGGVLRGSDASFYVDMYDALIHNKTSNWGKWLSAANVRYIIVDKLSEQTGNPSLVTRWDTVYPSGDPLTYYQALSQQEDLRIVHDSSEFAIFENVSPTSAVMFYDMAGLPYIMNGDVERAASFSTQSDSLIVERHTISEYSIRGETPTDLVMVINTSHDRFWQSNDEHVTAHFKSFSVMNGYIVKSGKLDATVTYAFENTYLISSAIAYTFWVVAFALVARDWHCTRLEKFQSRNTGK